MGMQRPWMMAIEEPSRGRSMSVTETATARDEMSADPTQKEVRFRNSDTIMTLVMLFF